MNRNRTRSHPADTDVFCKKKKKKTRLASGLVAIWFEKNSCLSGNFPWKVEMNVSTRGAWNLERGQHFFSHNGS